MTRVSRRRWLRTVLVGGAAVAVAPRRATAADSPEWASLVAAAKKEGKVVVNTFPGEGYGKALRPFSQAFPDIKLEHTSLHSQDFAPRIQQERKAGCEVSFAEIARATNLDMTSKLRHEIVWQ